MASSCVLLYVPTKRGSARVHHFEKLQDFEETPPFCVHVYPHGSTIEKIHKPNRSIYLFLLQNSFSPLGFKGNVSLLDIFLIFAQKLLCINSGSGPCLGSVFFGEPHTWLAEKGKSTFAVWHVSADLPITSLEEVAAASSTAKRKRRGQISRARPRTQAAGVVATITPPMAALVYLWQPCGGPLV